MSYYEDGYRDEKPVATPKEPESTLPPARETVRAINWQLGGAMAVNDHRVIEALIHARDKAVAAPLVKALREIAEADPNAEEVESWKWLARKFMADAKAALVTAERLGLL